MDRVFDLEKLLQISRDERQRLKGELSAATQALAHHADVLQEIGDLRTEKVLLEQALARSVSELDAIGRVVAELPVLGCAGRVSALAFSGVLPPYAAKRSHVPRSKLAARRHGIEEENLRQGTSDTEVCKSNLLLLASPTADHRNVDALEEKATHISMILGDVNVKFRACQETGRRAAVWLLIQLVSRLVAWHHRMTFQAMRKTREDYIEEFAWQQEQFRSPLIDKFQIIRIITGARATFLEWSRWTKQRRIAQNAACACQKDRNRKSQVHSFCGWKKWTLLKRHVLLGVQAVARILVRKQCAVVAHWQRYCQSSITEELVRVKLEARANAALTFLNCKTKLQFPKYMVLLGAPNDSVRVRVALMGWINLHKRTRMCVRVCHVVHRALVRKMFSTMHTWLRFAQNVTIESIHSSSEEQRQRLVAQYLEQFGKVSAARYFAAWREAASEGKTSRSDERKRVKFAMAFGIVKDQNKLSALFRGWQDVVKTGRQLKLHVTQGIQKMAKVLSTVATRHVNGFMLQWIRLLNRTLLAECTRYKVVFRQRTQKMFTRKQTVASLGSVFAAWSRARLKSNQKQEKVNTFGCLLMMINDPSRYVRPCFQEWQDVLRRKSKAADMCSRLSAVLGRAQARMLFSAWTNLLRHIFSFSLMQARRERWKQKKHLMGSLCRRMLEGRLSSIFAEWARVVAHEAAARLNEKEGSRHVLTALAFGTTWLLKYVFRAWQRMTRKVAAIKLGCTLTSQVFAAASQRAVLGSMMAWGVFLQRAQMQQMTDVMVRQSQKLYRSFFAQLSMVMLKDCFFAWRSMCASGVEKRRASKKRCHLASLLICKHSARQLLSTTFAWWQEGHAACTRLHCGVHRLERVLGKIQWTHVQHSVFVWFRFLHKIAVRSLHEAARSDKVRRVCQLWASNGQLLLKKAYVAWSELRDMAKLKCVKRKQFSQYSEVLMSNNARFLLSIMFSKWSVIRRENRFRCDKLWHVVVARHGAKLREGFRDWMGVVHRSIVADMRTKKRAVRDRMVAKLVAAQLGGLLLTAFSSWAKGHHDDQHARRLHRTKERTALMLGIKSDKNILHDSFVAWSEACLRHKNGLKGLDVFTRVMGRACCYMTRDALTQWLRYDRHEVRQKLQMQTVAEKNRTAAIMFQDVARVSVGMSFREWRREVVSEQNAAAIRKSHQRAAKLFAKEFESGFVKVVLSSWHSLCKLMKSVEKALVRLNTVWVSACRQQQRNIYSYWMHHSMQCRVAEHSVKLHLQGMKFMKFQNNQESRFSLIIVILKWKESAAMRRLEALKSSLAITQENLKKNAFTSIMAGQQHALHECWRAWVDALNEARREAQRVKEEYESRLQTMAKHKVLLAKLFGKNQDILLSETLRGWWVAVYDVRIQRLHALLMTEQSRTQDLRRCLETHVEELGLQRQRVLGLNDYRERRREDCHRRLIHSHQWYVLRVGFREWVRALSLITHEKRDVLATQLQHARSIIEENTINQQHDQEKLLNLVHEVEACKQNDAMRRSQVALACCSKHARAALVETFYAWAGPVVRRTTWEVRVDALREQAQTAARRHARLHHMATTMQQLNSRLLSDDHLRSVMYGWHFITVHAHREKLQSVVYALKHALAEAQQTATKEHKAHEHSVLALDAHRVNSRAAALSRAYVVGHRLSLGYMADCLRDVFLIWAAATVAVLRERASSAERRYLNCIKRRKPVVFAQRLWWAQLLPVIHNWRHVTTANRCASLRKACFVHSVTRVVQHALNVLIAERFAQLKLSAAQRVFSHQLESVKSQCLRLRNAHHGSTLSKLSKRTRKDEVSALVSALTSWKSSVMRSYRHARVQSMEDAAKLRRQCITIRDVATTAMQKDFAHHALWVTTKMWQLVAAEQKKQARLEKTASLATRQRFEGLAITGRHLCVWVLKACRARAFSYWARRSRFLARGRKRVCMTRQLAAERIFSAWSREAAVCRAASKVERAREAVVQRHFRFVSLLNSWALWVEIKRAAVQRKNAHAACEVQRARARLMGDRVLHRCAAHVFRAWAVHWRLSKSVSEASRVRANMELFMAWRCATYAARTWRAARELLCERVRSAVHRRQASAFAALRSLFEKTLRADSQRIFQSSIELSHEHDRLLQDIDHASLVHFQFKDKFRQGRKELESILKQQHSLEDATWTRAFVENPPVLPATELQIGKNNTFLR